MDIRFLFENAGPLLWPLAALSSLCLAAVLERLLFMLCGGRRVAGPDPAAMLEQARREELPRADLRRLRRSAGGRLLLAVAALGRGTLASVEVDRLVRHEFGRLRRKLRLFDLVVAVAPLLGILGTVLGLVRGFHYAAGGPSGMDPDTLAAGVAQALATTVAGLVIAVVALCARHAFGARADRAVAALEDYLARVEEAAAGQERS